MQKKNTAAAATRVRENGATLRAGEETLGMKNLQEGAQPSLPADIEQTYLHKMQATHVGRYPG